MFLDSHNKYIVLRLSRKKMKKKFRKSYYFDVYKLSHPRHSRHWEFQPVALRHSWVLCLSFEMSFPILYEFPFFFLLQTLNTIFLEVTYLLMDSFYIYELITFLILYRPNKPSIFWCFKTVFKTFWGTPVNLHESVRGKWTYIYEISYSRLLFRKWLS